jgi:TRAP-type C4-dicarboxylate transport system substrate-binding protein
LAKLIQGGVVVTEVKDVTPWKEMAKPVIEKYGTEYKAELEAIDKARKK